MTGADESLQTVSSETTQFHVLSFEGPDRYSRAGGIASRITGLTEALAEENFETHLWFVGDPDGAPADNAGKLTLHRWCQWISRYHPGGVYDGEEGKRTDFAASLPVALVQEHLIPYLQAASRRAVVLAEEWHTVDAVLHLDWILRNAGLRDRVAILWNANNTFGFDRVDWQRLAKAAVITTVSRYMKHQMWSWNVDPMVIPNGIPWTALCRPDRQAIRELHQTTRGRIVLGKIARWDPDKRWLLAIETVGELRRQGWQPLLIARGGIEKHGAEVLARAAADGLRVRELSLSEGVRGLIECARAAGDADVVSLRSALSADQCRVLYRSADAVLANSGREPFGLVGLEAMAAGGLACTGSTGEDYAIAGWNALVLQSVDPREFVREFRRVQTDPIENRMIRRRGTATARRYLWNEVVRRNLLPSLTL